MFSKPLITSNILASLPCLFLLSTLVVAQSRHALLVGIENYSDKPLPGCLLDVQNLGATLLNKYEFSRSTLSLLADRQATRAGILGELAASLNRVKAGDLFVFYYSGHGTLFLDDESEYRDETQIITPLGHTNKPLPPNRYDAALVPIDGHLKNSGKPWGNLILDDELYVIFSKFAAKGCHVVFISDSCFSGSLARDFSLNETLSKYLPPDVTNPRGATANASSSQLVAQDKAPDFQGRVLVFGASSDTQTSGMERDGSGSKFTTALNQVLRGATRLSYQQVFQQVRALVSQKTNNDQTPQLDTRFFRGNLNEPFLSVPTLISTNTVATASRPLKIGVHVADLNHRALAGTAIGLFPVGTATGKGEVRTETALFLGKADDQGVFVSEKLLPPGKYRLKVVNKDYQKFEGDIELIESADLPGAALLFVKLKPEQ